MMAEELVTIADEIEEQTPLPEGWRWAKLSEIALVKPDNGIFKRRHEFGRGVPIINILDLFRSVNLDLSKTERVEVTDAELNRYSIYPGDLFFCRSSLKREGIGWCCYIEDVIEPSVFECHIIRIRPNPEIAFYKYIAHYWRLSEVREKVIGRAKTSTMTTINQQELAEIEIPLPPTIEEQRRIATALDEQMKVVEEARLAVEEQLKAVELLPSAFLCSEYERLDVGNHRHKKIGQFVLEFRNGFGRRPVGRERGKVVLRIADVSSGVINLKDTRQVAMSASEFETYKLQKDDVLFVRVNGSSHLVGRCIAVKSEIDDLAFNDHLIRAKFNDDIDVSFLEVMCRSQQVRQYIVEKASTSAGQLTVNQEMLSSIEIPVPPTIEEQRKIAEKLNEQMQEAENLKNTLTVQLEAIKKMPSALLRKAFAGEI